MRNDLKALLGEVRRCRICVEAPEGRPLPHEPRPVVRGEATARLAICGQAPGTRVHASGVPFADPSGDRLREWMGIGEYVFYDEEQIAILPMGFCFPGLDAKGGDLPPRKECGRAWRKKLMAAFPRVELVLLVGRYAQAWHLRHGADGRGGVEGSKHAKGRNLTETVRRWGEFLEEEAVPRFFPLPHPSWRNNSWIKKNAWFEAQLLPRLRLEVRRVLGDH